MEIGELEAGFDDAERVGEEGADESGYGGGDKVVVGSHGLLFELPEAREVDVAPEGSLEASSHESLVESFDSIFLEDVLAGGDGVVEEVVLGMEVLEATRGQHEGHFDVFEGLQHDRGHCSAYQPVNTILINH